MQRFALATAVFATLGLGVVAVASAHTPVQLAASPNFAALNIASPIEAQLPSQTQADSGLEPAATPLQVAQTTGNFVPVAHAATGRAYVETVGTETYLVLDQGFSTDSGPDLKVILYGGSATTDGDIPDQIAEGSYVELAPIQSFSGEQRYVIPADINVNDYWAASIWCRAFNVTFSYAAL